MGTGDERILKLVGGGVSDLTDASIEPESRPVVRNVELRMGRSYEGLCVAVGDSLGTLPCKSRGDVGVDGHLVKVGPLETN